MPEPCCCPNPVRLLGSRRLSPGPRGNPLAHVPADAVDGLVGFGEHGGEEVPDVNHLVPYLEGNLYARRLCALCQAGGVVKEHLTVADLHEHWGQAAEIGVDGRDEWVADVRRAVVLPGEAAQRVYLDHWVGGGAGLHRVAGTFEVRPG